MTWEVLTTSQARVPLPEILIYLVWHVAGAAWSFFFFFFLFFFGLVLNVPQRILLSSPDTQPMQSVLPSSPQTGHGWHFEKHRCWVIVDTNFQRHFCKPTCLFAEWRVCQGGPSWALGRQLLWLLSLLLKNWQPVFPNGMLVSGQHSGPETKFF